MTAANIDGRRAILDAALIGNVDTSGMRRIIDALMIGAISPAGDRTLIDFPLLGVLGDPVTIGLLKGFVRGLSFAEGIITFAPPDEIILSGLGRADSSVIASILAQAKFYGSADAGSLITASLSTSVSLSSLATGLSSASAILSSGFTFAGAADATSDARALIAAMVSLSSYSAAASGASGSLTRAALVSGAVNAIAQATGSATLTPGSSADTDAKAYLDAYAPNSSATFKAALNNFVTGLKSDGLWAGLDWLCVPADTSAGFLRNLRNLAKAASAINLPAYTAYRGFTGDGSSSYIDLNEPWSADGNNLVRDSGLEGIYINGQTSTANVAIMGNAGTTRRHLIQARAGTGSTTVQLNSGTAAVFETNPTTKIGHKTVVRADASSLRTFVNGAFVSNPASTSTSTIGMDNGAVLRSTTSYSPDRAALFYSGSAITDSQVTALNARVTTFLTAIGAN